MGKTLFSVSGFPTCVGITLFGLLKEPFFFGEKGSFHPHNFGWFTCYPPAGGSAGK
jgi:hypothetical protein